MPEIQKRRSEFAFSPRLVEEEKINALFSAAQLAPSSMNNQPWRYIYATPSSATFETIVAALNEGNRRWAKDAPLLIVSIAQNEYEFNGNVLKNKYAWHDTGMANILLMIEATHLGLVSHPMGGFSADVLKEALQIPPAYEPILVIAVGYAGEINSLPNDLQERQNRPRIRMQMANVCFHEKWPVNIL
jgi:nitroreductase